MHQCVALFFRLFKFTSVYMLISLERGTHVCHLVAIFLRLRRVKLLFTN